MPWWTSSLQTDLNVSHGSAVNGAPGRTRTFRAPAFSLARTGPAVRAGCPAARGAMDAGDLWGRLKRVKRNRPIRAVVGPGRGLPEPGEMAAKRIHDGRACIRAAGGHTLASS